MINKRSHTFDSYRENNKKIRMDAIRKSLSILENSNYKNITNLAKDVSKIVHEIELKHWELKSQEYKLKKAKPEPLSYTTLLRNKDYKNLLSLHMTGQDIEVDQSSISDVEVIKIKCAHLESQNEMLTNRLKFVDAGENLSKGEQNHSNKKEVDDLREEKAMLIEMIESIMGVANDIFALKDGGLYSYNDILIIDELTLNKYKSMTELFK